MNEKPLVSIIINNHNYGCFLGDAIQSALDQTYPYTEIVVIDDGSTDNSREIIQNYRDRVTPIFTKNRGQSAAFNTGFAASRGSILCFLDSDDLFRKDKVQRIVNLFSKYHLAGWVFHHIDIIDARSVTIELNLYPNISFEMLIDAKNQILLGGNPPVIFPPTSALCFRRETLEKIFPIPISELKTGGDRFLRYAAVTICPGIHCSEQLAIQRIHDSNAHSFRKNAYGYRFKRNLITAFYLRNRFPEISAFLDKEYGRALGSLIAVVGIRKAFRLSECQRYAIYYFNTKTWILQGPRIMYNLILTFFAQKNDKYHLH